MGARRLRPLIKHRGEPGLGQGPSVVVLDQYLTEYRPLLFSPTSLCLSKELKEAELPGILEDGNWPIRFDGAISSFPSLPR